MEPILKEVEQTAERCLSAATTILSLLDDHDMGFLADGFSMVMGDVRRPSLRTRRAAAAKTESFNDPVTAATVMAVGSPDSMPPGMTAALQQSLSKVATETNASGFDKLRAAFASGEHPAVRAANEANATLEYLETSTLPKIDVLAELHRDSAIKEHQAKVLDLMKRRRVASMEIEKLILEFGKQVVPKLPSPEDGLKLLNFALGPGQDVLVGFFVGCSILGEVGLHLKKICSRIEARMALAAPNPKATEQREVADKQRRQVDVQRRTPNDNEATMKANEPPPVDIVILTAIEVELWAVLAAFGLEAAEKRVKIGTRVYWRGEIPLGDNESYSIVVGLASDMANTDAAVSTADMLNLWRPNVALLVGIAASAVPTKIKLGDVVVGREIYYYERGKAVRKGLLPEPKILRADPTLLSNLQSLKWKAELNTPRPDTSKVRSTRHVGVIACGEQVVADAAKRDKLLSSHRKILAIEMEGYGFLLAAAHRFETVRSLVIRGISDDGSENKDDHWHHYAATAAADVAKQLLLDRPLKPRASPPGAPSEVEAAPDSALRSLEKAGHLPVFRLRSNSRNLNQPEPGKVTFGLRFVNEGPCAIHNLKYSREGQAFAAFSRSLHPREDGGFSWIATLPAKDEKLVMAVSFRYSNGFGDNLQEDWQLTFDSGAASTEDVLIQLISKRVLPPNT